VTFRLARTLPALALAALLGPSTAHAQFATTNVQLLHGFGFEDVLLGYDTGNEQMTTLTLNHFSTWKYGDNFAFVDMYRGDFGGPTGYQGASESTLYAEWHPRLFLNRLLGRKGNCLGIFKDFGLAFEVNQGPNFYAYMAGVGGDLALPIPGVVGVNLYYRNDSVQVDGPDIVNDTWQVSPYWTLPFKIAKVPFVFTGFVDVSGTNDNEDVDVMAQPELLVDVLGAAGGPAGKLLAGVEWYLHYNPNEKLVGAPSDLISAPQVMVQWNLH
jgi:nucleoside-specific outer membrane channel protein Tsx